MNVPASELPDGTGGEKALDLRVARRTHRKNVAADRRSRNEAVERHHRSISQPFYARAESLREESGSARGVGTTAQSSLSVASSPTKNEGIGPAEAGGKIMGDVLTAVNGEDVADLKSAVDMITAARRDEPTNLFCLAFPGESIRKKILLFLLLPNQGAASKKVKRRRLFLTVSTSETILGRSVASASASVVRSSSCPKCGPRHRRSKRTQSDRALSTSHPTASCFTFSKRRYHRMDGILRVPSSPQMDTTMKMSTCP